MKTSRPPMIATWILHRFGAMPETETIAGDLAEQYQQRRSRLWYWRQVTAAVLAGIRSEAKQHGVQLLLAVAAAWTTIVLWQWLVTPLEYSFIVRYVFHHQAAPQEISLLSFLLESPLALTAGWTVARCAPKCRIPAVFVLTATTLLSSGWSIWENSKIVWPESPGYHWSGIVGVWPVFVFTILLFFGAGLLTGPPKRSIGAPIRRSLG